MVRTGGGQLGELGQEGQVGGQVAMQVGGLVEGKGTGQCQSPQKVVY